MFIPPHKATGYRQKWIWFLNVRVKLLYKSYNKNGSANIPTWPKVQWPEAGHQYKCLLCVLFVHDVDKLCYVHCYQWNIDPYLISSWNKFVYYLERVQDNYLSFEIG